MKPLKIAHYLGYDVGEPDFEVKCSQAKGYIDSLIQKGFGGVVTNVSPVRYLEDEEAFKILHEALMYCRAKGMKVWIYDEDGYPSGGAGGITLRDNPELEAKAIAGIFRAVKAGETVEIKFPHGHTAPLCVYAYNGSCFDELDMESAEDLMPLLDSAYNLVYENRGVFTKFIAYIALKPCYENCHAEKNVFRSRRYIDLMSKEAVRKFIENTYEVYKKRYSKLFGGTIEAFFTDEPSLMAYYLNNGLEPAVHDVPDRDIPMLPHLNWTDGLSERFKTRYGYNLLSKLVLLFGGGGDYACKVRLDYHRFTEKLYEEAFFCQIEEFCRDAGVDFSGHILYEESVKMHTIFEGSFFTQLRHMDIPGIDILTTLPERIIHGAMTPKLVSSVAELYGRYRVMSEVSSHIEGGRQTPEAMLGACVLQYALGVNVFTSYYGDNAVELDDYNVWNGTIGRIDNKMGELLYRSRLLLYYPIETAQMNYIPQHTEPEFIAQTARTDKKAELVSSSFAEITHKLSSTQLDYTIADRNLLGGFTFENGEITPPYAKNPDSKEAMPNRYELPNRYEILILPPCEIDTGLLELIEKCDAAGVKVLALYDELFLVSHRKAMRYAAFKSVKNAGELVMDICALIEPDVLVRRDATVAYMKKENRFRTCYLFVNYENTPVKAKVDLYGSFLGRDKFYMYNPKSDIKEEVTVEKADRKIGFELELGGYGFVMFIAE